MVEESVGHYNNGVEALRAAVHAELSKPPFTAQNQRVIEVVNKIAIAVTLPKAEAAPEAKPAADAADAPPPGTMSHGPAVATSKHLAGMPS